MGRVRGNLVTKHGGASTTGIGSGILHVLHLPQFLHHKNIYTDKIDIHFYFYNDFLSSHKKSSEENFVKVNCRLYIFFFCLAIKLIKISLKKVRKEKDKDEFV